MDQPWSFLPNWATGCKPAPGQDPGGHGYVLAHNPVRYAFRTCGLVRGEHPYVLVVDDIRKDDEPHRYEWLMQVPGDVRLEAVALEREGKSEVFDLVLRPADEADERRLLVRVVQAGDGADDLAACRHGATLETYGGEHRRRVTLYRRLVLPLRAVAARYKVLLVPYRRGEKLPTSAWSEDGTELRVAWSDQRDAFAFALRPEGRPALRLRRLAPGGDFELNLDGTRGGAQP